jgi:uncharacterized membrane protein
MLKALDWIIIALLVLAIVMFSIGKGDTLLDIFSGGRSSETRKLYDKKKMDHDYLLLCIVLLIVELLQAFVAPQSQLVALICLIVAVVVFVAYIAYMQKIRNE